ncbi:MAG TPA: hypothetical protein VJR68_10065 [Dyella sp.]|nr:hypothetical protein [Dyella sp.]
MIGKVRQENRIDPLLKFWMTGEKQIARQRYHGRTRLPGAWWEASPK